MEQWRKDARREVVFTDIDALVPKDHLLRKIERVMDYDWLYERLDPYYCHDNGRPGVDPVVLIKMVLLQHLFGIPSLRQTHRDIQVNVAYRWFLGYGLLENIPHFATVSYALFYANVSLPASGTTVTLSGKLVRAGISGEASSEMLAGKVGRPQLDGAYLTFENAAVEAGEGENVELASAELATADGSVLGKVNAERSLLWADKGGTITVGTLNGVSTSQGNWTKIRDENNSYAGQPMEVIMQWGMGAALYASQGGILTVGDPTGARSHVSTCGDGANGVLATGILDGDQPSQIYVYNTDFDLSGWNNHVVDTIYADLYAEYADEIDAWGGKDAFYAAVNDIADRYGYGEAYHAADDALLRNSMFDNTYYAIMRNGFQYKPLEDGRYSLDALADWSDVPYLGASNLSSFQCALIAANGTANIANVNFVYDDTIGADYRYFSTGKGTVNLENCTGASGLVTNGTINFAATDFAGSFAAGSKGLWDGETGYVDANGEFTYRNGNYTNAEASGAVASFTDGSVWTVTHDSYLAGLTLGADASVVGADGAALTMTVNGAETPLTAGTYEGEIVITLG